MEMAKLYYDPHFATISVRADYEKPHRKEIEITADQALALATSQVGLALNKLVVAISDAAAAVRDAD
jgi:hypothetical protein